MLILDELLVEDDFARAVDNLSPPFMSRLDPPPVHQLGVVVPEIQAAADNLEGKGVGPFLLASGPVTQWSENGKERRFTGKLGLGYFRGKEIELLEPGSGSNFYLQHLDPKGRFLVQHLGFLVKDVDDWSEKLTALGCPLWVRGKIKTGPVTAEFAYMDAIQQCGFIVEFICFKFLGISGGPPQKIIHMLGNAQKRSGKRVFLKK